MGSHTETLKLGTIMIILAITLVFFLPAVILGLPQDSDSSCSSQTCLDCLGSCSLCDQCSLCALCFLSQCVSSLPRCKYCKEGAEGCKKTCNIGKKTPVCKKCIETCSRDVPIPADVFHNAGEGPQIEEEEANEENKIE